MHDFDVNTSFQSGDEFLNDGNVGEFIDRRSDGVFGTSSLIDESRHSFLQSSRQPLVCLATDVMGLDEGGCSQFAVAVLGQIPAEILSETSAVSLAARDASIEIDTMGFVLGVFRGDCDVNTFAMFQRLRLAVHWGHTIGVRFTGIDDVIAPHETLNRCRSRIDALGAVGLFEPALAAAKRLKGSVIADPSENRKAQQALGRFFRGVQSE